ncbi:LysR family transcriptional regulator [Lactobacillus sp. PV037]|uniref:LysR family transcriptional regulator n=1 Tax=Lactobacillus sp. PV037 TaxID=2594496 RepID=UPI00223EA0F7|nr:LysR family transcriptional regulator [Lactobacillus sp. PV037]QNQ83476.1 LysR family transcriptional regulator [Lactobacillus sp. PV037]
MDTRVLNYFLTVAKTGNVTKAANKLHITQPTLSRQISDLEKQLNITLFDRTNRHLRLTKAGTFFKKRAELILELVSQTEKDIHTQESELSGIIRIGCVESSASTWLMKIIKKMNHHFPNVQFDIYTANGDDLKEKLDQNSLDLALLLEPIEAKKYNYLPPSNS